MTRKFSGRDLLIATHNRGKLAEFETLLRPFDVTCRSAADMGLREPEETKVTFLGNARIKAHAAAKTCGIPALSDDSGLMVDALGGAPGVQTADWAETPSGRDFILAMTRTHDALLAVKAPPPWTARFCCTLVLAWPDGHDEWVTGFVDGTLVWPRRGLDGHGFDPMFQPNGHLATFAEMPEAAKNLISHRALALRQMVEVCFT